LLSNVSESFFNGGSVQDVCWGPLGFNGSCLDLFSSKEIARTNRNKRQKEEHPRSKESKGLEANRNPNKKEPKRPRKQILEEFASEYAGNSLVPPLFVWLQYEPTNFQSHMSPT
jgi:hypothetical protein